MATGFRSNNWKWDLICKYRLGERLAKDLDNEQDTFFRQAKQMSKAVLIDAQGPVKWQKYFVKKHINTQNSERISNFEQQNILFNI